MSSRAVRLLLAAALVATACAAGPSRPRVDPDAMQEVRPRSERLASPRAIAEYLEARRRLRAGEYGPAVDALRLAVTYDPGTAELRVAFAEALALAGQLEAAEGEARRALELDRAGAAAAEAHTILGRIAAARQRPEVAVAALREAIRLQTALAAAGESPDPEPWRLLADVYLAARDEGAAVKVLDDLAVRRPGDGGGFRELGRALLEKGELGRAERHLKRALELAPADVEARRLLARTHEALGRTTEARDDHLALLRRDPDDEVALLALGRIALRADDAEAAREWFRRQVRVAADAVDARVRIAFQWLEVHRPAEALAVAREGIAEAGHDARLRVAEGLALEDLRRWADAAQALSAVRPEAGDLFVTARVSLAYALSRAGRHADADRALDAPLAARPGEVRLVTMRAHVLDRAGRAPDAVKLLRRAIQDKEQARAEADLPDLYTALAEALVEAGRPAEAVEAVRGALATRPRDEALLYALGTAYERAGQNDAAVAQMKALLTVNPDHADALNFLGYAYADRGERLDEAERLVRRALDLRPRSGYILDSLGWVHFRRGDFARAVQLLEQAAALAGPEAAILEHLGDAYRASARPSDAAGAYRRALRSSGDESPAELVRQRAAIERKLRELSPGQVRSMAR